jgi:hypothetical protein
LARRLAPAVLIIGLLSGASAAAVADVPITIPISPLRFTFNTHFAPVKLPKGRWQGIRGGVEAKVSMEDGSHPPALGELVIELDRNIAIDPIGLPACKPLLVKEDDIRGAEMDCKDALVGTGQVEVNIAFPEQAPISVSSDVLAFNAGRARGKVKLLLHAYLSAPVSAAIVIPVVASRTSRGRFGLQAIVKVPKIAGGYGSITRLSLQLGRKFPYEGKQRSYLLAKCPDGHLIVIGVGVFSDGSRLAGSATRVCIPQAKAPGPAGQLSPADRSGRSAPVGSGPPLRAGARRAAASAG